MDSMKSGKERAEVIFKLGDVLCPEQAVVIAHLGGDVEVVGRVSFLSDGGCEKDEFAIIEVPGITVPLVVPKSRLRMLAPSQKNKPPKHSREALPAKD
jgi:hypothetical protein